MDSPKQMLWNIFCTLVRESTLSITASQENAVAFIHRNYDYFILCDNWNLVSFFYIQICTKKQAFDFLKRNSYQNVCLKFLCNAKLITPPLIFWFLVKIWSENSISIPIHSGITYVWIWLFGGAKYQGRVKAEARGTYEQPLSDKPPLIRCVETYSTWQ